MQKTRYNRQGINTHFLPISTKRQKLRSHKVSHLSRRKILARIVGEKQQSEIVRQINGGCVVIQFYGAASLFVKSEAGDTVSVITSQNLTCGNRHESAFISTDKSIFDPLHKQVNDLITNQSVPLHDLFRERITQ